MRRLEFVRVEQVMVLSDQSKVCCVFTPPFLLMAQLSHKLDLEGMQKKNNRYQLCHKTEEIQSSQSKLHCAVETRHMTFIILLTLSL